MGFCWLAFFDVKKKSKKKILRLKDDSVIKRFREEMTKSEGFFITRTFGDYVIFHKILKHSKKIIFLNEKSGILFQE